ncbi:MAG TPA: dTDP-4-dehydrorhamnose reductase [bacterium]
MKILVTGANGQLAKEIINISTLRGYSVISKSREELDITILSSVCDALSSFKPNIVINCAAYNDVDRAETDWQNAFLVNGTGVKNLSIACSKIDAEIVHLSSDYVFDGLKGKPYTIVDKPAPVNKYGESKLLGEELLKRHSNRFFLIRTSWVFGTGKFSFPKRVIEWASKNKKLRIVDDQISIPSYNIDVARAAIDLIQTGNCGLYHITNSGFCSRYSWARRILNTIKWQGELEPAKSGDFQTPAKRPGYTVLDGFPLQDTIGYLLPSWEDATERFLRGLGEAL